MRQLLNAADEELDFGLDAGNDDYEQQQRGGSSSAGAAARGGAAHAKPMHGERRARFEQGMQQHIEEGLQWHDMRSPELAAYPRQDCERWLAAAQQRIDDAAMNAAHLACGHSDQLRETSRRPVCLVTMVGRGVVQVPSFWCAACVAAF